MSWESGSVAAPRSAGDSEAGGGVLSELRVRTGPEGGARELAFLVHHVEIDVEAGFQAALLVVVLPGDRRDPPERLQLRFLGRLALAQKLEDRVRTAGAKVAFAPAGRTARAELPAHA